MPEKIKHNGTVTKINADTIEVHILSLSACSTCANSKGCGMTEAKDKQIIVPKPKSSEHTYTVGEEVDVLIGQKKAFLAIFLSYFIPAVLLVVTLFVAIKHLSETAAALVALGVVGIYFLAFILIKPYLNKKFEMSIRPKDELDITPHCSENQ